MVPPIKLKEHDGSSDSSKQFQRVVENYSIANKAIIQLELLQEWATKVRKNSLEASK
jgi:hypothetical protein